MQLLFNHISPETAFLVLDYPYGFRLRCQIRYWLEYKPGKGFRFCSQTTNPKRGHVWNKSKASTYSKFGGAMYLNEENHTTWSGLSEYAGLVEARAWFEKYGSAVPEAGRQALKTHLALMERYDKAKQRGEIVATMTVNGVETSREVLAPEIPAV